MSLLVCGINHQTAPLVIREKIHFTPEQILDPLKDLIQRGHAREAAILSTCNRTEVYCSAAKVEQVVPWLMQRQRIANEDLSPYFYAHHDRDAVRHMLRVASGLDSMILGEPEIFGQMKTAFSIANMAGTIGNKLHRLFEHVFAVTKVVRTDTAIGGSSISLASVGVNLAKGIFADLAQCRILFIGAGETIELVARHFYEHGMRDILFANRTLTNAERLVQIYGGIAIPMRDVPHYLATADIVVSATASVLPILGKGSVESALKARRHRPMCMLDLAVPRDIEPEVRELSDVYLYTLDDLQLILQHNFNNRKEAVQEAEKIIDLQAEHFISKLRALEANQIICAYRDKVTAISQQEINKALRLLQNGEAPERVLELLGHALSNKLMHAPSAQLRQAAYDGQLHLLDFAKQLFELDPK